MVQASVAGARALAQAPYAPSQYILGMRADLLAADEAVRLLIDMAKEGGARYCCVTNVHQCVMTYDDPAFRAVVNGADLAIPDSTILRATLRLRYGVAAPRALRGDQLMLGLCAAAERASIPVALIGGKDEAVLANLGAALIDRFPRLEIAFAHSPPFRDATDIETAELVAGLRAEIRHLTE